MGTRTDRINTLFYSDNSGDLLSRCAVDNLLGEYIGEGVERTVFSYGASDDLVIKVERCPRANILEWEIWNEVKDMEDDYHAKWFAPCKSLSRCGHFLVQEMTYPISPCDLPKVIPSYMADTHSDNWGQIGKRKVCHDYANNLILKKGLNKRLVKARFV